MHGLLLDRIPSGQPGRWLYDLMAVYPSRPAKTIRPALCLATCAAFGGRRVGRRAVGRRDRDAAQRVPRPRRHRRRQRACAAVGRPCTPVRASGSRSTPATRWPSWPSRCCARAHARLPAGTGRPGARRVRHDDGCAPSRARRSSSAGGATTSSTSPPRTTST